MAAAVPASRPRDPLPRVPIATRWKWHVVPGGIVKVQEHAHCMQLCVAQWHGRFVIHFWFVLHGNRGAAAWRWRGGRRPRHGAAPRLPFHGQRVAGSRRRPREDNNITQLTVKYHGLHYMTRGGCLRGSARRPGRREGRPGACVPVVHTPFSSVESSGDTFSASGITSVPATSSMASLSWLIFLARERRVSSNDSALSPPTTAPPLLLD